VGAGVGTSEADPDAGHHDVHVGQLSTDLLHHDGVHAVSWISSLYGQLADHPRFKGPIQGITQTNSVFSRYEGTTTGKQILGVKAVYVVMQLLLLGLGIYKVNAMGLLPTTRSDWLAWETERQPLERAYFAFD
jgi:hypothetical protein